MRSLIKPLQRFISAKFSPLVAAVTLLFSLTSSAAAETPMHTYVAAMQPGTNGGNTLDATPDRHSWGAPDQN